MPLSPECYLGSDPAFRRQALYDAFGGTDCFLGLSPDEQEQKLYETLGGTECFGGLSREERRYALYVTIGGDDPCFRGSSPQQQETLFYEAMYALAGDATLVDPACFRGLSPDERSYWLFRASVVTGNPHPECVAIMGETGSTYVLQAGDEGYYIRCKVTATNSEGSDTAWSNAVGPVEAASGGALLVDEDFEGAGKPASATDVVGSGGWDNATAPLAGSQDFKMVASTERDVNFNFTASDEVWITFLWSNTVSEDSPGFLYLQGATQYISLGRGAGPGDVALLIYEISNQRASVTDHIANSTPVKIFLHAKKGTGSDAIYDVEWSDNLALATPTGTGNKFASYTAGTQTEQWVKVEPYHAPGSTTVFQFDNLKVSNTGWPP